ncbi:GIY-YIG nuclease family protein [Halocatena marina]|uniref:GIY-YIG nuclease family protein n=1 Tax=Halocatena marina TaxID=2934937 RepID=A0ABD5YXF8_9EURY|nr:GIY-YIG nuclease family protein [Halocatena marina]
MTLDARKVYLMDSGSVTKIGYATDPDARLSSAQSGNPQPLRLVGVIETDHALRLEEKLHRLLSDYRCEMGGGTEWFDLPPDIYEVLAETSYLSVYTLELLLRSEGHESEPENPLLLLDSVSITPSHTRKAQRELIRSAREQKDRLDAPQRITHHTSCVFCNTEGPSGKALVPPDAHVTERVIIEDMCRECAEDFIEEYMDW